MAQSPIFEVAQLHATEDVTLVLGRRTSTVAGHRVHMHNDVANELRAICSTTIAALGSRTPVGYSDDLSFDSESQYMVADIATLIAHIPEPRRGRRRNNEPVERPLVEIDAAARQVLADASSLPQIDADEIERRRSFLFSAAVVGNDPGDRLAFVSAYNPYRGAERGRLLTSFGDGLRRVSGPLLSFPLQFDMIVAPTAVAVLRPEAFEKVFRDIDSMRGRIPIWSKAVRDALPFDDETAVRVEQLATSDGRVTRYVRSMYERGVLARAFPLPALGEQLRLEGFDADRIIKQDRIVLDEAEVFDFLKLIDERLMTGWHSGIHWDVATRARR